MKLFAMLAAWLACAALGTAAICCAIGWVMRRLM